MKAGILCNRLVIVSCVALLLAISSCCSDDYLLDDERESLIFLKSRDTSYKIIRLYMPELSKMITGNLLYPATTFAMPLTVKIVTLICYASDGRSDTVVFYNDFKMRFEESTFSCPSHINYEIYGYSVLQSSFDSTSLKAHPPGPASALNDKYWDTLYFKP